MTTDIGAYDAKRRLPELLRRVKLDKRFTITHRGKAIADLVPSEVARPACSPQPKSGVPRRPDDHCRLLAHLLT